MAPDPRPAEPVPPVPVPPVPVPPVLGRPSRASARPGALRPVAESASAAYRADGGDGAGWTVRAASIAGVRHRQDGHGPQDAYAWRVVGRGPSDGAQAAGGAAAVILAVADGVGSVAGSAAAAAAAVEAAVDAAGEVLATTLGGRGASVSLPAQAEQVWSAAFAAADAAAARAGGATTLVLAVIGGDRHGLVARIGDSCALLLEEGSWHELWPSDRPDDGPLTTATAALPAAHGAAPAIEVAGVTLGPGTVLALVTDGIANPLRDGPTTVAPAFARALVAPPTPLALAVLADFSRQGCFDDRTVVGLWVTDEQPRPGRASRG